MGGSTVRSEIGQYATVPMWLAMNPDISSHAVRLFAVLAGKYANKEGEGAYPRRSVLAKSIGASEDTVDRALRELEEAGAVDITPRYNAEGRISSAYVVMFSDPVNRTDAVHQTGVNRTGAQGEPHPRGSSNQTQSQTQEVRPTVRVPRARLKDTYGEDARQGVAAYADSRKAASLPVVRDVARLLPRPFMKLRSEGWTQDLCLRAVQAYATTKRSPLYFREWVMQTFHGEGDAAHEIQKREGPIPEAEWDALLAKASAA